jgi:hypothetical protein
MLPTIPHRSILLMTLHLSILPVHCKCLYSLANQVLPFPMFHSPNPLKLSPKCGSTTLPCAFVVSSSFAQLLPISVTESTHRAHTNDRKSIALIRLLTILCIPGGAEALRITAHFPNWNAFLFHHRQSRIQSPRLQPGRYLSQPQFASPE